MYKQMSRQVVNPNQELAILHTAGPAQVIAGPGSGKTFVTVHRILHLITEWGVDPARILVITFTKAAALEMQERFFRLTQPKRPPVRFGTFHAVFYHILKQSARYQGYSIMTESEKRKQIRQIVRMYSRFASVQEEDLEELTALVSNRKTGAKQKKISIQDITEEDINFLLKEYESYQQEFGQMDFDDIMILCHRLLAGEADTLARWQEQFQYILVDEFQDISPLQYEIVKMLAAPQHNLFIVGDDDQSIYGFRGAKPGIMMEFTKDYPKARQILLDINYRSTEHIVNGALRVIGHNEKRYGKKIRAQKGKGETIHIQEVQDPSAEGEYVLETIREYQEKGIPYEEMAVLYRTSLDARAVTEALAKGQIPFVMKENIRSLYDHFIGTDLMSYLRMSQEGCKRRYLLRIANRPKRYLSRESMEGQVSYESLRNFYCDKAWMLDRIDQLEWELKMLKDKAPYAALQYIRKGMGYDDFLREYAVSHKISKEELLEIADEIHESA